MRRKVVAILLSMITVLSLLPATAFAAGEYTITYEQSGEGDSYCLVWVGDDKYSHPLNPGNTYTVPAGAEVRVTGNRDGNTLLGGWEVEPNGLVADTDNQRITFTMPEQDVTLTMNVSTLDPHASFDEGGTITWDAVEGYKSSVEIRPTDDPGSAALIDVTGLEAQGGKYAYDVRAALRDKNAEAGSYTAIVFYYKGKDRYNDLRAVIENAATYNYSLDKQFTLTTPTNLHWDGYVATWDAVDNAASYEVTVTWSLSSYEQTVTQNVSTTQLDLRGLDSPNLHEGAKYKFAVKALPESNSSEYAESAQSSYSDSITYRASAAMPTISVQPQDASYTVGDSATALSVTASVTDEGSLSYQWYRNTTDSSTGGTLINGENTGTYTPPTDTAGTAWYYCVVTNTLNGMTAQTTSDAAKVEVVPAVISYGITVAGVEVTSKNANDVLGDGTVVYLPSTNTLQLTNASIKGADDTAITADGGLRINLIGDNTCTGRIKTGGDLEIYGTGNIADIGSFDGFDATLRVTTSTNSHHCIESAGHITISNSALDLTAEDSTARAITGENITISNSYVRAKGPNTGISCDNGTIDITGSTVVAEGRYGISAGYQGSIEIRDSTATLNGTDSGGAYAQMMTVENSNVSVSTESYDYSMWILDTLTIKNSTFTSQSPTYGICAGNILVDDSTGETPTELTVRCDNRLSIYIHPNTGQFKVTPKDGVLMDAFAYISPGVDGPGIYRIEGAPFDTEKVLADSYGGNYFQLKVHEHEPIQQDGEVKWSFDESSHWNTCVCDAELNSSAHTFEWVTDKEATAAEAGSKHEECTVCGYEKDPVEIPATGAREQTPQAEFVATSDTGGMLSNVEAGMKYSVDGGKTWNDVTSDNIAVDGVTAESDVKVYKPGDGIDKLDSDVQTIDVTQATRPAVDGTDCTTSKQDDGKITGVDASMEYRPSTDSEWTAVGGDAITGLSNGTYEVRTKASGTVLASPAAMVTINKHTCVSQEGWHYDELGHWQLCVCGEKLNNTSHSFKWVTDKEATATEAGSKHEECTVCGYEKDPVEIPATGAEKEDSGSSQSGTKPSDSSTGTDELTDKKQTADGEIPQTGDSAGALSSAAVALMAGAALVVVASYVRKGTDKR